MSGTASDDPNDGGPPDSRMSLDLTDHDPVANSERHDRHAFQTLQEGEEDPFDDNEIGADGALAARDRLRLEEETED